MIATICSKNFHCNSACENLYDISLLFLLLILLLSFERVLLSTASPPGYRAGVEQPFGCLMVQNRQAV